MSSLFKRRRRVKPRPIPVLVPAKSASEEGFNFELLNEEAADECIDTMTKAMPQVRWSREGLRRGLLAPNSLTLIARQGAAIVGIISGTAFQTPIPPPTIGLMAVLDQASGERGLGGYLVDEYMKAIQKRSPKATFVDVSLPTIDTGSIALYSLKGFVIEGFVKEGFSTTFAGQASQDLVILRRRFATTTSPSVV
jgi:hypothetical protein